MRILKYLLGQIWVLCALATVLISTNIFAQEATDFIDLGIEFSNPPTSVKINGVFGVVARVKLESNSSDVPTSETVRVHVMLQDPNGLIIDEHTQSWDGFNSGTDGLLKKETTNQMLFQIPWAQAINWDGSARWTIRAEMISSSIDFNPANDSAEISLGVDVPDLVLSLDTVMAVDPLSGNPSSNFVPNTNYSVSGTITNIGNVMTQPGIYIPITAILKEGGEPLDEETILLPSENQFQTLGPNASWNFEIDNLFLPAGKAGNFTIEVTANPSDIVGGPVQIESDYSNNEGNFSEIFISDESDADNDNARPDLKYVVGSYSGERGSFRGLEPVYLSFAIRNSGARPVAAGDSISAQILLSKDLEVDDGDFLLREFNLGGSGIGEGLLAGETVSLTWFQQMPDNYEGDYYLLVGLNNLGTDAITAIDSTPIITLTSEGKGQTSLLDTSVGFNSQAGEAERPDSSRDGRFVVYEKTQQDAVSMQAFQQIYMIDMEQPNPEPKLISRSYSSTPFVSFPANGNSFRPKISEDGSTVVFYSSATNLVPGDTNNKEDVFLYRLSTDTLFRGVFTRSNDSTNDQLNGRSLYPEVNGDGTKVVFESDATNNYFNNSESLSQIFLWELDENGDGTIQMITNGNGNSYNPSIDTAGRYVVFDSFATNLITDTSESDTNNLRDIFLVDLHDDNTTYLVNKNIAEDQATGGPSQNPKISGEGNRIVFESMAQNLITGTGIAQVVVTEGGYGYEGNPTIRIYEDDFNASGAYGTGAILTLKENGINRLKEIQPDAILIVDPGSGYVSPRVEITPDPAYPAPLQEAKAVAYLANPLGDVYYVDVADIISPPNAPIFSQRISESSNGTGGNFGSRDLSISSDGNSIVYATKSSNLLPQEVVRDDGKTFYNSNYILPSAKAILVGGIGEIEIKSSGSGYQSGVLRIDDLSGSGSGAMASYQVDNHGRIVRIDIIDPGENYQLDQTIISVSEPRGGQGFVAGELRFVPTAGEGVDRTGGGRIYKVEMTEFGYGYKIGDDENASFADIIQFEGDGADLNEDGFPDGRIDPDRVINLDGSLYLEQRFDLEVMSLGPDLLNSTLTLSDNNNSLEPLIIQFSETSVFSNTVIGVNGLDRSEVRDEIIKMIYRHFLPDFYENGNITGINTDITLGPVLDQNLTSSNNFRLSALSGKVTSSNPSAIRVVELSNMLVMGSGYTTVTPVINQVPNIFGFSETKSNPTFELDENVGRVAFLSEIDTESDDIYLYDVSQSQNFRISTSSFGMPVGYLSNNPGQYTALSNRFPSISGDGRYVFFSSDAWGNSGLAFFGSNQLPADGSAVRDIYLRDLKTYTSNNPKSQLDLLFPKSGVKPFAPQSPIPVIADLNHTGTVSRVAMILNQTDRGGMTEFGGGFNSDYQSNRYTSVLPALQSGEYSLQLVAYGVNNKVVATSSLIRFKVSNFEGSLPPNIELQYPSVFSSITSTSVVPIAAVAEDLDGAVEKVHYYIDGTLHHSMDRIRGISESEQTYSFPLDLKTILDVGEERGMRSLFAIAEDNSGNHVASGIRNFSFTKGSERTPTVAIQSGVLGFDVNSSSLDINVTNGSISSVELVDGAVGRNLFSARVEILSDGNGRGAILEPIIQTDPNLPNYGKITDLNVTTGGFDYASNETFALKIIPNLRVVNEGIRAVPCFSSSPPADQNATSFPAGATLSQYVDGSYKVGSGYVISPRLVTFGYVFNGLQRVPLVQTDKPTSHLENFNVSVDVPIGSSAGSGLFGGFTQSTIVISVEAKALDEVIESVSLVINGIITDTLNDPTIENLYNFSWLVEETGEYNVYALVRDNAGNVTSSDEQRISISNYEGSGISASFSGDAKNYEVESNGQLILVTKASSEYGIAEVEFFIGNVSVGKALNNGGSSFQTIVNLEDFNFRQGEHEVSIIARDQKGNSAGTFSRIYTNLESRLNRTLTLLPPITRNVPEVSLLAPEHNLTIPLNSSLRLLAMASDPDGGLKGLEFFVDDQKMYTWNGKIDLEGNESPQNDMLLVIDDGTGRQPLIIEFDDDSEVVPGKTSEIIANQSNYLNDLSVDGNTSYPLPLDILIEIDGVSSSGDTFKWSRDGGITFIGEREAIFSTNSLIDDLEITFQNDSGHRLGDRWSFKTTPLHNIVTINESSVARTKYNLYNALLNLYILGETSIRPHVNENDSIIYLSHDHVHPLVSEVSVTIDDKNLTEFGENMLLNLSSDSKLPQPFGATWKPDVAGKYVIVAVAEDNFGNRTGDGPIVVDVVNAQGVIPEVKLRQPDEYLNFDGSPITTLLYAEAKDPDGSIAEVSFYGNGVLIERDSSRPYSVSFEINATGHYEVYAIARDNSGNLVSSNAHRIIAEEAGDQPPKRLLLSATAAYLGGVGEIEVSYTAADGHYEDDISALVYQDGIYVGNAEILPRSLPGLGEEDSGQAFIHDLEARSLSGYEFEIIIINGNEVISEVIQMEVDSSPFQDNSTFLSELYKGLYGREPAGFEQSYFLPRLNSGEFTKMQVIEELRRRLEFRKGTDALLAHKTLTGEWSTIENLLNSITSSANSASDDHADIEENATLVYFNQTIQGRIDHEGDIDHFRIDSLTPSGSNGKLTLTILPGHPEGIRQGSVGSGLSTSLRGRSKNGSFAVYREHWNSFPEQNRINGGGGYLEFDLTEWNDVDYFTFYIAGQGFRPGQSGEPYIGSYTLVLSNMSVQLNASVSRTMFETLSSKILSPVNNFSIFTSNEGRSGYMNSIINGSWYTDLYGVVGTHNPEEFFRRIYGNKFDQQPSPVQIMRALNLMSETTTELAEGEDPFLFVEEEEGAKTYDQAKFLEAFTLDNSVISYGAYNYTEELAIPNVPLDMASFAETALVYSALIGTAPTKAEVAKITLTPEYNLRPMTERARMIMEMPAFAARYGLAMPEVDLPNLRNGRTYSGGEKVLIDASSLGADSLGGTHDDGYLREITLFLNGQPSGRWLAISPDDGNITRQSNGFYFEYDLPVGLPSGKYDVEVRAEDKNGLISRANRSIIIGESDETVHLETPKTGEIIDIDNIVRFDFELSDPDMFAYLEINGVVPWLGLLQFDGTQLPEDESNLTITDGFGHSVTFEFDTDGTASRGQTVFEVEEMYLAAVEKEESIQTLEVTSSSRYDGIKEYEYTIEIDGDSTSASGFDSFRWSLDGGARFNNENILFSKVDAKSLSAGLLVRFESSNAYSLGDRWRIQATPINEIVEVARFGTFAERLNATRQNLIEAINRAANRGKLMIHAQQSVVESASSGWFSSLNQNKYGVELRLMGSLPLREAPHVEPTLETSLEIGLGLEAPYKDCNVSTDCYFDLDMRQMGFTQPMLEARVVAFDDQNNTIYSEPHSFSLRDPSRLSIELTEPVARKASIRLKSSASAALTNSDFEILDGGAGYTVGTAQLSVISESGSGALLRAGVNEAGEVSGVDVLTGGAGYSSSDLVLVSSPLHYKVGDSISVSAKVRDPLSELDRVAFYVNGVELDADSTSDSGTTYSASYEFSDESAQFVTARALFGDDRDAGPNTISEDEWMSGPGIAGDRINYWGWRRHWAEQHFHGSGYVFPEWFISDQEYWALPPPWLSLPYGPGAVPVQVTSEVEVDAISITSSTSAHVGSVQVVGFTFRLKDGDYANSLSALIFIDGQFAGMAKKLGYDALEFWEEDPGYQFEFALPVHTAGQKEVEIFVTNGADTFTAYTTVNVQESPLTDDNQFLKSLWNGLFDRDPLSAEINAYFSGLRNGSMTRPQVIEHIRTQQEFITSRDVLLTHKTLHGVWEKLPIVLENTDQQGYGSMGGSADAQAVMGMPYTPADGNASDLGFYEGVADDHSDLFEFPTEVQMNDPSVLSIVSKQGDRDVFKIKSLNLPNEGLLTIQLNRAPLGTLVRSSIVNPLTLGGDFPNESIIVQFPDGSFVNHAPKRSLYGGPRWNRNYATYQYDLSSFQNVESYIFSVKGYSHRLRKETLGVVRLTISNDNYLDQANFLADEDVALLQIESRVNDFNPTQAIAYQTGSFSYTNRYGQIETHDPASLFHRLFLNKYDQEPNPMQANRGVQLLKDGTRSQLDFLQQFATENNIITVGGYNYTTSANELAIPNVPIDAAAFAETALVYTALLDEAPTNAEIALLTLTPDFEIRPLANRARLIMEKPEYAKQHGVAAPEVSLVGIQSGQFLLPGDEIKVEASSLGPDDLAGTVDDGKVFNVELFLNGKSQGMMTPPPSGEFYYSLTLDSTINGGEYLLEAVAEDINGLQSRAEKFIRIAPTSTTDIEITTPALGSTLEWGETVDFNFSSESTLSHAYLEINGRAQWAATLSYNGNDLPEDGSTFSIDDGTGRGAITFEFDDDGLSTDTDVVVDKLIGEGEISLVSTDLNGTEARKYIIEIDGENTFRWSMEGGEFNETLKSTDFNGSGTAYTLDHGVSFKFENNASAYAPGDRWRIEAKTTHFLVDVGKYGLLNEKISRTRQNISLAIKRARAEGKLAILAEDAYYRGAYKGSIPEQYVKPSSIILHHDGSYPVVSPILIEWDPNVSLSEDACMDLIKANSSQNEPLSLFLGGCLEMPSAMLSARVVGFDGDGNRSYSRENIYPVRNPAIPYSKILKIGDVFAPGRVPTVQVTDVFPSSGAIEGWEILDSGVGYKSLVSESHDILGVSPSGRGAEFEAEISSSGSVENISSVGLGGQNYEVGDLLSPSPPAVFELGQSINLDARLNGPKSQIARVVFYANGVEIPGDATEKIGGYYSTTFQPADPGDYFISIRTLFGDSRDSGENSTSISSGKVTNPTFVSNDIWVWRNLWSQQFISSSTFSSPAWFWQNSSYWDTDISWKSRTNWAGAAAVRVIEPADDSGEIEIALNSSSLVFRTETLLDSQWTQLKADVTRSSRNSPSIAQAILYGNDAVLAEIDVPETNATYSKISFDWEVSFRETGKRVLLTVVGMDENNNKYYSDSIEYIISEPSITEPSSLAAHLVSDLTGGAPSGSTTSQLLASLNEDSSMGEVIEEALTQSPFLIENLIDMVAVQHIIFGKFFDDFYDFQAYAENWLPEMEKDSSEEPLKRFIDTLLSDYLYSEAFRGGVPHLVGASTANQLINFGENRNLFVTRHFSLKYGRNPTTLQLRQASQRMLDYWSNNHEPGYWESISSNSAATEAESYSGFRRDTSLSRRPTSFDAGECAVDFIYELAKEFSYPRNQAYLSYISNSTLRNTLYRSVALLYSLHRENIDLSEKSILQQAKDFQGLSQSEIIKRITDSSSFTNRFNYLFDSDSAEVDELTTASSANGTRAARRTSWKSMPWFGTFMDSEFPWIYHVDLGWLYSKGTSTDDIWFYSDKLKVQGEEVGWFWTNNAVFDGPSQAGGEYGDQRFIFLMRKLQDGSREGSWALLNIETGEARPYGWLPLGK